MLINAVNLTKSFGDRDLFTDVSFLMEDSDKIGFIGPNGAGKTTLFKMITNLEPISGGEILKNKNTKIGYLPQNAELESEKSVLGVVMETFSHLTELEKEIEDLTFSISSGADGDENINRLSLLQEKFENLGGYTYKAIARSSLLGLGFSPDELEKPFPSLSGGQKTRVLLCKILLSDANLLLLDEPTNHLDIKSLSWLEDFLLNYKGGVIVISHDRYFLDRITNKTLELEDKKITLYNAGYSGYRQQKKIRDLTAVRNYEKTKKEIERIEGIIAQQKQWNRERNIRTAESKQKVIDRLAKTLVAPPEEQKSIRFKFSVKNTGSNEALNVTNLACAYGIEKVFSNVSFNIRGQEKVVLLGDNGCGKTTLFKAVCGLLPPIDGEISIGTGTEIAYYSQIRDDLNEKNTVFDEIYDAYPSPTPTEIRNSLAAFLFFGEDVFKPISELSGGEKARISILKLMLSGANFLLLDEPTNHLDIESREALEQALSDYEGTMFAVSHDRYFINRLARKIIYMESGRTVVYDGNYDYFLEKHKSDSPVKTENKKQASKEDYQKKKAFEARLRKLRNDIGRAEKDILAIENQIEENNKLLSDDEYASDYVKAGEISKKIETLEEELAEKYEIWEKLNSELETAE